MKKDYFKSKLIAHPHYVLGGKDDDPIGDDDEVEEKDEELSDSEALILAIKMLFPWLY